jgi:hypothetical protein
MVPIYHTNDMNHRCLQPKTDGFAARGGLWSWLGQRWLLVVLGACVVLAGAGCASSFKSKTGMPVPRNLEQAYLALDDMFTEAEKTAIRTGAVTPNDMLLTFGMQLKEYWGLWQDSHLAKYLRKRNVDHPDHMVTVIFEGYARYLNAQ